MNLRPSEEWDFVLSSDMNEHFERWCSTVKNNWALEVDCPGFEFYFCHLFIVCLQANHLAFFNRKIFPLLQVI